MSIANPVPLQASPLPESEASSQEPSVATSGGVRRLREALERVQAKIAPVWPLQDYVAVNPYLGFADQDFLAARRSLRSLSDCELLMSMDYYRDQFARGAILKSDIDTAVDEMVSDGLAGAEAIDVNQVLSLLHRGLNDSTLSEDEASAASHDRRPIRTISEVLDGLGQSNWTNLIRDEISKHCSMHYDQGQAIWPSPWQDLPLYQAWRSASQHDRTFEVLGVKGFRKLVAGLPHHPHAALAALLRRLDVPEGLWEEVLHCHARATVGWSAWTRYKQRQASVIGEQDTDFAGLLAVRLAYEVSLSECFALKLDWDSLLGFRRMTGGVALQASQDELLHYALLKASEIAYRRALLTNLASRRGEASASSETIDGTDSEQTSQRTFAQMVFCIDVRSERIRRHLEESCQQIKTYGFAGFFGLPLAYVPLGESKPIDQVPALLSPRFKVQEFLADSSAREQEQAIAKRSIIRAIRQSWKEFQSSAVSCFGFVEMTGLLYGWRLVTRSFVSPFSKNSSELRGDSGSRFDGVVKRDRKHLSPCLSGLESQGVTASKQADMAESILRGISIVDGFARLMVLCGHGSRTENNPLQAGLDCGACGGHSGEANARFAAKLLNQKHIRESLADRGISIGDDVQFVSALHNTTTDDLQFFDVDQVPQSHRSDLQRLMEHAAEASRSNRSERMGALPGNDEGDLVRRSLDWSEVRPEWGLAGNAAFIAAPRDLTGKVSLAGRSFLHSYDYRSDPDFKVLEQIMTAPMIVANWINLQYYASTVDPAHFGSGNKAIHNVVGRFGILTGNGGDLMTGLPWQSIHDGVNYQHHPLRLLVVLAAPRQAIARVIEKHASIKDLLTHGWLHLIALDEGQYYRFSQRQSWDRLPAESSEGITPELFPSMFRSHQPSN